MFRQNVLRAVAGMFSLVAAGSALATEPTGVDVTALEATIMDGLGPIGTIGLAVLSVLAAILIYKLIRRAM